MSVLLSPLHRANRQISIWFEEQVAEMDVSLLEGHLISSLRTYAPCPIAELVRVCGLKQSTMTSLLDRLEARGVLTRELNPHDRRSFLIALTRDGRQMAGHFQKTLEALEAPVRQRVSPGQVQGFQAVMAAVDSAIQVDGRDGGST